MKQYEPRGDKLEFTAEFTDPMWGTFPITKLEENLLNTRSFSRLEQIKQVGVAFLDYPALSHTRLEHSLGVLHVADTIYKALRETTLHRGGLPSGEKRRMFDGANHQAVRVAALLHDLGHPPFSHAVELTFKRYPELLRRARALGESGLARIRRNIPTASGQDVLDLFTNYSHENFTRFIILTTEEIRSLIVGHFGSPQMLIEIADLAVGKATHKLAAFNQIISGDFDADKIDYLIRDNRRSGFAIGLSPDELYNAIHFRRHKKLGRPACWEVYIDRNALPFVNSVLAARERLIGRVHLATVGRTATQMITKFLCEDLLSEKDHTSLAETIIRLHRRCTDFTFFDEVRDRLPSGRTRRGIRARTIEELMKWPSKAAVWKEYGRLSFMRMHPSLRLLAYISADAAYPSPGDLEFLDVQDIPIFIEPSSRPTPKFSLMVDYNCDPVRPGLDYIGATENRQGRAILSLSLSNLDIFGYELEGRSVNARRPELAESSWLREYLEPLTQREAFLAQCAIQLATEEKKRRYAEKGSLAPIDFLLAVLHALDEHLSRAFRLCRGAYVYRSEYFISHFMQTLARDEAELFPAELLGPAVEGSRWGDANRIFTEIQRLEVFGLVESRRRTIYQSTDKPGSQFVRRTRERVYTTREDFRISVWGKEYVAQEIDAKRLAAVREIVKRRQDGVFRDLRELSRLYSEVRMTSRSGSAVTTEQLNSFYLNAARVALSIKRKGGCAMIFTFSEEEETQQSAIEGC